MTANPSHEIALFDLKGTAVAKPKPRKAKPKAEVARTATGESAADILGAWIDFCQQRTGMAAPSSVRGRLSSHVKSLITDGYEATTIKNGMLVWTARWVDNPLTSPTMLEQIVWKLAMDGTPEGRRFQDELKAAVVRLNGTGALASGLSNRERRNVENTHGKLGWREAYARRKQMEEGL